MENNVSRTNKGLKKYDSFKKQMNGVATEQTCVIKFM